MDGRIALEEREHETSMRRARGYSMRSVLPFCSLLPTSQNIPRHLRPAATGCIARSRGGIGRSRNGDGVGIGRSGLGSIGWKYNP